MQAPIIGITCNIFMNEAGAFPGVEKCSVNYDYIRAIEQANGIPVLLPVVGAEKISQQLEHIDGLLLSGGYDVLSLLYGEEAQVGQGLIYPQRDEYEIAAIKIAYAKNIPILGICRGIQILNVAFGGTLYQDLCSAANPCIKHMQQSTHRHIVSHTIDIVNSSRLFNILGCQTMLTNSFHHQAIKIMAANFTVNAVAKDGIIEGIEDPSKEFVLAVQFHPETMNCEKNIAKLFSHFILAASMH